MATKDNSVGRWVSVLYRYGQCYLEKKLQPYNLGSGQFIFLVTLLNEDNISQETLANKLHIDKGTTARAIKKLEETGYIKRKADPEDKRVNKVYITEKALEIQPALQDISIQWTNLLTANLSSEEKEIAIDVLRKMSEQAALLIKDY